jgi:hypothetical protein
MQVELKTKVFAILIRKSILNSECQTQLEIKSVIILRYFQTNLGSIHSIFSLQF